MSSTSSQATRSTTAAQATPAKLTAQMRWTVMLHALMFVLGFTIIFAVVIGSLAGALSWTLRQHLELLRQIMGVVLIVFGVHSIGLIHIRFLNYTRRLELHPSRSLGYLRSLLIGMGFAIGWTPCTSILLGAIFTMSLNGHPDQAILPFLAYSLGLGVPFLLAALAMGQVSAGLKRLTRRTYSLNIGGWTAIDQTNIVSLISGIVLIGVGVLVLTNWMTMLIQFAPQVTTPEFGETPTLVASFLTGLVSFLSPCVFPLIPVYIGYLSGPAVMGAVAARRARPA